MYRIAFHLAEDQTDAREVLRAQVEDLPAVAAKLRDMGDWTQQFLELIQRHPRVSARQLAPMLGLERLPFKADVRRLKALGLTVSHNPGYTLSPRGEAVLRLLQSH